MTRDHMPEGSEFGGAGVSIRRVHQAAGQSDGAVREGLVSHRLHVADLGRRGGPIVESDAASADGEMPGEHCDVDGRALGLDSAEVLCHRAPSPGDPGIDIDDRQQRTHGVGVGVRSQGGDC